MAGRNTNTLIVLFEERLSAGLGGAPPVLRRGSAWTTARGCATGVRPPTETALSRLVYVLNGPNLNLLGKRQPHIYGAETLADVEAACRALASELGLELRFHQSNREYEIVDWIHEARETAGAIAINPAAFTHTSVAILDALNAFDGPVIEVHISNVHKREAFRHHSYVSLRADGVIAGFGTQGYGLALRRLATLIDAAG
jgi:3-dehydroquinate dehydratase II